MSVSYHFQCLPILLAKDPIPPQHPLQHPASAWFFWNTAIWPGHCFLKPLDDSPLSTEWRLNSIGGWPRPFWIRDQLAFWCPPPATPSQLTTLWPQHWAVFCHHLLTYLKSVNHSHSLSPELFLFWLLWHHTLSWFSSNLPGCSFFILRMGFSFSTPLVSVRVPSWVHSLHVFLPVRASTTRLSSSTFMLCSPDLLSWPPTWALVFHILLKITQTQLSISKMELIFYPKLASPLCSESICGTTIIKARNTHSLHLTN